MSFSASIIDPSTYDDAVASCRDDLGGVLAPLADTAEITAALCSEVPTDFRIQGIAKDECWVDHEDQTIDAGLLDDQSGPGPYETLYIDTANEIIKEEDQNVSMAFFCQFPKDPGK